MTPQDLEDRLHSDVKAALSFLNVVVSNNRERSLTEIEERPDVQEALEVIREWLDDVMRLSQKLPDIMQEDRLAVIQTVMRMHGEMDDRVWASPQSTNSFLTRLVWLMAWLLWPFILLEYIARQRFTKKTWISRLSDTTCSYCRRLHGVSIPITESFAPAARAVGWVRIYGSLMTPPLHPNCGCTLIYS